jgi:chromosome segregation ATPase
MRIFYHFLFALAIIPSLQGQDKVFRSSDQKLMVVEGMNVQINADTAYIIGKDRAKALNEKLVELTRSAELNQDLKNINQELLDKVKEVEKLVGKLLEKIEADGMETDATLESVIKQLDEGLTQLESNNRKLKDTNKLLDAQIKQLEATIKDLKKEIRGIWWNGILDKIVVGGIGVGVGILIAVL